MQSTDQEYRRKVKTTAKRSAYSISTYAPTPVEPKVEAVDLDPSKKQKSFDGDDIALHTSPTLSDLIAANAEIAPEPNDETNDALMAEDESDQDKSPSPETEHRIKQKGDITAWRIEVDLHIKNKDYHKALQMLSDPLEKIDFAEGFDLPSSGLGELKKQAAYQFLP